MDIIKELGLEIKCVFLPNGSEEVITVQDLKLAIEKLPVVYGFKDAPHFSGWKDMDKFPNKNPSHQARLIGVEKLVKEPVRVERQFLNEKSDYCYGSIEVPSQIKGKPFKVVFEEVIE